jgi:hypothetical protein
MIFAPWLLRPDTLPEPVLCDGAGQQFRFTDLSPANNRLAM